MNTNRNMWERHPDFRVAKLSNGDFRVRVLTDRAKDWCNRHLPSPIPCTTDGDLILDATLQTKVANGVVNEGFELGDFA